MSKRTFLNVIALVLTLFAAMMINIFLAAFGIYGVIINITYLVVYLLICSIVFAYLVRIRKQIMLMNLDKMINISNILSLISIVVVIISFITALIVSWSVTEYGRLYYVASSALMMLQAFGMQIIFITSIISFTKVNTATPIEGVNEKTMD